MNESFFYNNNRISIISKYSQKYAAYAMQSSNIDINIITPIAPLCVLDLDSYL